MEEDLALGGHEHTQVRMGKMGKAEGPEGHSSDTTDVSKPVLAHPPFVALALESLTCLHPCKQQQVHRQVQIFREGK